MMPDLVESSHRLPIYVCYRNCLLRPQLSPDETSLAHANRAADG